MRYPTTGIGTTTPVQSIYEASATPRHAIGERFPAGDGRVFYYGKASLAIAAGQLVAPDQSDGGPWLVAVDGACIAITVANRRLSHNDQEKAITAALAINDYGVGIYHTSYLDGIVAGQLAGGFVFLNDTGGVNQYYKIEDNTAHSSVTTDVVELLLVEPIAAVTVDSTCSVSVMQSPFMQLALCDSTVDEHPSGVPAIALSTTKPYGWIQTWGECSILTDADTAFGGTGICISTTAGACGQIDTGGILTDIGHGMSDTATAGDGLAAFLKLRP